MSLLRALPTRWHISARFWAFLQRWTGVPEIDVESLVIPCVGREYVEEGTLCARFAHQNLPALKEIILVTDLTADQFVGLPRKVRVETISVPDNLIPAANSPYRQIWRSRLLKLQAPTLARYRAVLMIDSDLLILREFKIALMPDALFGSLHRGKIGHRMKKHRQSVTQLREAPRLQRRFHINGGFLLAERDTWNRLSQEWVSYYLLVWNRLPQEVPVDQIPLVMVLDALRIHTVDMGPFVNWSVPKRMGGREVSIPPEVIGAHGGFPLAEWEKYLANPSALLKFMGEDYTRKARYQKEI